MLNSFSIYLIVCIVLTLLLITLLIYVIYSKKHLKIEGESIIQLINDVSRLADTIELRKRLLKDFVDHNLFGFDYAIFSEVDFADHKIKSIDYFETENYQEKRVNQLWINRSSYLLQESHKDDDILTNIYYDRNIVFINGESIVNNKLKDQLLNKVIVKNFNHRTLKRYIVPIIHRSYSSIENIIDDIVIGTVELGVNLEYRKNFRYRNRTLFSKDKLKLIKLYCDNFAQPYYKCLLIELNRKLGDILFIQASKYSTTKKLEKELTLRLHKHFKSDFTAISTKSFKNKNINFLIPQPYRL